MSLEHQFIMLTESILSDLEEKDVCSFMDGCQTYAISKICVEDEYLQSLLFDPNGKIRGRINFNEWGITIIDRDEQSKWILLLQSEKELKKTDGLLTFFIRANNSNMPIVHFGI